VKKTHFYPLAAILFAVSMILVSAGIYWFDTARRQPLQVAGQNQSSADANQEFTLAAIAEFDGKDGKKCYVAVDGVVYEIFGSSLWLNGSHITSSGRASCGRDLSEVIKLSPHGKIYLNLPVVTRIGKLI
jgi:predicted heme/steroid binding protein